MQPILAVMPHQVDQLNVEQLEHEQFPWEHEAVIEQQLTSSPSSTRVLTDLFADESPYTRQTLIQKNSLSAPEQSEFKKTDSSYALG